MEASVPNSKTKPSAEHSMNTMKCLRRDEKHYDAVIEAEGKQFKIHRSVFAVYSDYFDKVFTVEMQEKYSNVVKIEDTSSDIMKCIVDFIYTGQLSISRENAVELLVTADYLHIEKIKQSSENFLLNNVVAENCVSVWICANTYGIKDLLEKSLTIFGANLSSIPCEELERLNKEHFVKIMESSKPVRKSEEKSFNVTATWTKYDFDARKEIFYAMFQRFDLRLFSKDFLMVVARTEPLVSTSTELLQKVVVEFGARLEKASKKDAKARREIARLEKAGQVSGQNIKLLTKENKDLRERVHQVCVRSTQQAEMLQKLASQKFDRFATENERLNERLEWFVVSDRQSVLELEESAREIASLTDKNKRLKAQVAELYSVHSAKQVNDLITKLTISNKQLIEQNRRVARKAQKDARDVLALKETVDYYAEENNRLLKLAKKREKKIKK